MTSFSIHRDLNVNSIICSSNIQTPPLNLTDTGHPGDLAYDTTTNQLKYYDGVSWVSIASNATLIDSQTFITDSVDPTKRLGFDIQGTSGITTTMITAPTAARNFTLPDISGTALVSDETTGIVLINATTQLHGSNTGVQYSSTVNNRGQYRANQYGNHIGPAGFTSFKSRGSTIGSLASVLVGDDIYRVTAIGVTDNLSIPLSGSISIQTSSVPAGQGYIGTAYEVALVSEDGPSNGKRPVFRVSGEGIISLLESTSTGSHTTLPSGVVTLDGSGVFTVSNSKIPANARILLTVQPGTAPTGHIWVSNITVLTSFTITSTAGVGDSGVNVYYQIYTPLQ
jgi:hypothetical protein